MKTTIFAAVGPWDPPVRSRTMTPRVPGDLAERRPLQPLFRRLLVMLAGATCVAATQWTISPEGQMSDQAIPESSGVVVSRRHPDVLWTHNDSRNPPEIFAVKENGKIIRSYYLAEAQNNDWEDIAFDENGYLYLLDNTSRADPARRNVIYYFPEPDPYADETVEHIRKFTVSFPDGAFDCEAMFVWRGAVFLVTKPWDGSLPRIYRYDKIGDEGTAEYLGDVPVYAMVTGGDISTDGSRIALSSYTALIIFEGAGPPEALLRREPFVSPLNAGDVEGICWDDDELVITNEAGQIFRIKDWEKKDTPFPKIPLEDVPFARRKPAVSTGLETWPKGAWLGLTSGMQRTKIARVLWTLEGLHVGIELPDEVQLRALNHERPKTYADWFRPGSLYLMVNPNGLRPVAYGENDRCIFIGRSAEGSLVAEARYLRPATVIRSSEPRPPWIRLEQLGRRLLVTLTAQAPGLGSFYEDQIIGFNLLLVETDGQLLSWAPLTRRFTWDAPNTWGLLRLDD